VSKKSVQQLQEEKAATMAAAKKRKEQFEQESNPTIVATSGKAFEQNLGARLDEFAQAERSAVMERDETLRAQVTSEVAALAARARSAQTALGALRSKWYDAISSVANLDIDAVKRRMPLKETVAEDRNGNAPVFISNHTHLVMLVRHARLLAGDPQMPHSAGALGSDFEELKKSMEHLASYQHILFYETGGVQGFWDPLIGGPSVTYRQAKAHTVHWIEKIEAHIANVRNLLAIYERLHARVADDLAGLDPLDVAAPAPKAVVGTLPPLPPEQGHDSIQGGGFDPREDARTWAPQQRTRAVVQPGLAREVKQF
jgi:hypothetical protein